jgi:hypothetical protein
VLGFVCIASIVAAFVHQVAADKNVGSGAV